MEISQFQKNQTSMKVARKLFNSMLPPWPNRVNENSLQIDKISETCFNPAAWIFWIELTSFISIPVSPRLFTFTTLKSAVHSLQKFIKRLFIILITDWIEIDLFLCLCRSSVFIEQKPIRSKALSSIVKCQLITFLAD